MFDFNMDEYEANNGGPVPKGTYLVQVEKSELEDTKKGGQMIKVQFNIVGEQQNGRKLFEQYNIVNDNPEAVKIGLGKIKSLIQASGANVARFTSPDQLIGLECLVNVKTYEDDYGEKNAITTYKKLGGNAPTQNAPNAQGGVGETNGVPNGPDGKPIF